MEASGPLLLRSLCRLTHKGHLQYAKGDGHRFEDWLQKKYNGRVVNRCAGRAEFSKRQDWCLEASWKFHNLIQPVLLYTIETLVLDPNILRDSGCKNRLLAKHIDALCQLGSNYDGASSCT